MTETKWILLRGLARESRHWGDFPEKFQEQFPKDQILLVDLPGTGERRNETSPLSVDGIMRSVRKHVHQHHGSGQYSLFSVSLGGMVALAWMDQFPKEISQAVIVNSSSQLSPFYQRLRWESWRPFVSGVASVDSKTREERILRLISNDEKKRSEMIPLWTKLSRQKTVSPKTAVVQLAAASRYKVPTRVLGEKALFVVGMGDRLVEPICSEHLSEHFGSPLIRHPWAGHDIPIDDPQWLLARVAEWRGSRHEGSMPV